MNLLLLRQEELAVDGRATIGGRRARHLIDTLGVAPGRTLRAGLLDGPSGRATVVQVQSDHVVVDCRLDEDPPARSEDLLLLAVPRPKVLCRCVEHATALGFGRIVLVRTWFTDKSHLASASLSRAALETHVIAGLEQSRRTRRPDLHVAPLFRPFVEDELPQLVQGADCYLADPDAAHDLARQPPSRGGALAVAIGPERGFNEFERELLVAGGFRCVHGGRHPLRVETAVTAIFAQLDLLRRRASGSE